jgi:hypothetical protein
MQLHGKKKITKGKKRLACAVSRPMTKRKEPLIDSLKRYIESMAYDRARYEDIMKARKNLHDHLLISN